MGDDFHFRRATKTDYEEIISLAPDGEYEGDYLPDCFNELMDDPLFDAFVCVVNEQIVGIGAVSLVDGGITGVMRSGRIKKEYRGKGILRRLQLTMLQYYPNLQYSISTTASNLQEVYRQIDKGTYKLICIRNCVFYSGRNDEISFSKLENRNLTIHTRILNETDLMKIIQRKKFYPNVFEIDRLIVKNVPYRLMEENVPIILSGRTHGVISFINNSESTLLTFGSYHKDYPSGNMYCKIDIYGSIGKTLITHFLLHIQSFIVLAKQKNFTIEVFYVKFSPEIESAMTEIGLRNASVGTNRRNKFLCIEQDLRQQSKL